MTRLTDIDFATLKMSFPADYIANEAFNKAVCDYFLEVFRHIEQSEKSMLLKLGIVKKSISCTNLVVALFERNDFKLFEGFLKVGALDQYFFLKLPLIRVSSENSAIVCGEIVVIALRASNRDDSFFREYRKKFYEIVSDYLYYLIRLILSSYSLPTERSVTSNHLKVGSSDQLSKVIGRHNVLLVEVLQYGVKWDKSYKRDFIANVNEMVWEITMDWFFTYAYSLFRSSNTQYANTYIGLIKELFINATKADLCTILCRSNFFGKLTDKLADIDKHKDMLKLNNQNLLLVFIRKLVGEIKFAVSVRDDIRDVKDSLHNLQNHQAFINLVG